MLSAARTRSPTGRASPTCSPPCWRAAPKTIIVESPDRFARDLLVQLTGHDLLKARGITLIAASAPTHFTEDTPTARLIRQVLGAVAEFEKAALVVEARGGAEAEARGERQV